MLLEALYSAEDVFLIDIDDGQHPDTSAIERFDKLPNVYVQRNANIGWGGAGTLRKTINGALFLLGAARNWDYYIVLSGQDLPLQNQNAIKEHLARNAPSQMNYIRTNLVEPVALESLPIDNPSSTCHLWGDRGHTRVYAKPGTINPQVAMGARWLVDVAEIGEKGEVYVGTCDPLLLRRRQTFFQRYPFYMGANWFNLHRSVIQHLRDDPFAYELYDVLRTTFIPDESFFQTYIMHSPFKDRVDRNYGRLILRPGKIPRVKVFDMHDLPAIEQSDDLFGRKFDVNHDQHIVRAVLDRVA